MSIGSNILSKLGNRPAAVIIFLTLNLVIFIAVRIVGLIASPEAAINFLALSSSATNVLSHPWTVVTYMFTQYDLLHILFNMLALYWFGSLLSIHFGQRRIAVVYLIGGLAGAAFYLAGATIFPVLGGDLIGASAAVMATMVTAAVIMPDYELAFLFIGAIKLKWIAICILVLFAIGLTGNNAGGHVAHLGGMTAGLLYGIIYRRHEKKIIMLARSKKEKATDMQNLDALLDKIKRSGYSSLTYDEKERLSAISNRIKQNSLNK